MDTILQIFKWIINHSTPFFESLAKKSLTLMDDLFRRANKYAMLQDDGRAASHLDGQNQSRPIRLGETENEDALTIKSMDITKKQCKNLHYLLDELIKVRYLKQYTIERAPSSLATHRVVINYIHEEPIDDKYHSKRHRHRLLHIASIREIVHTVQCTFTNDSVRSIDGPITFLTIDSNLVIMLHENALVLTLGVNDFDVRRILINPGSSIDLLQMLAYKQMRDFPFALKNHGRILTNFNGGRA
ncbi:hypothetical protein AAG906_014643 [Vitis piasezkii]